MATSNELSNRARDARNASGIALLEIQLLEHAFKPAPGDILERNGAGALV
jgi:hypothetical protein